MHFLRVSALLLAIAAFSACSDGTAPRSTSVNRQYVLESLNGQPLPVTTDFIDLPLEVVSGTLTLDSAGYSITRTSFVTPTAPVGHNSFSTEMDTTYVISRDSIYFGKQGHCADACDPLRSGSFTDSVLTIRDPSYTLDGGVFGYRLVAH